MNQPSTHIHTVGNYTVVAYCNYGRISENTIDLNAPMKIKIIIHQKTSDDLVEYAVEFDSDEIKNKFRLFIGAPEFMPCFLKQTPTIGVISDTTDCLQVLFTLTLSNIDWQLRATLLRVPDDKNKESETKLEEERESKRIKLDETMANLLSEQQKTFELEDKIKSLEASLSEMQKENSQLLDKISATREAIYRVSPIYESDR